MGEGINIPFPGAEGGGDAKQLHRFGFGSAGTGPMYQKVGVKFAQVNLLCILLPLICPMS